MNAPSLPAEADIPWHTVLILPYSDHELCVRGNFNGKEAHTPENIHSSTTTTHSVGNTSAGMRKVVQFGPHCPKKLLPK
jgi:hypothetical protein